MRGPSTRRELRPAWAHRWLVVGLVASLGIALPSHGQGQPPRTIDLGEGLSVRQVSVPCGLARCLRWEPHGLRFTGHEQRLASARTFALVPSEGRVVASYNASLPGGYLVLPPTHASTAGMLATDDGGRTWHQSRWPWPHVANAVAFDRDTPYGVAVGDSGYTWSSEDGGRTWRDHRSDGGVVYTQVAVLGRLAVFADSEGRVWRSRDGGFSRRSLIEHEGVRLETDDDAVVVESAGGDRLLRVYENGRIERD